MKKIVLILVKVIVFKKIKIEKFLMIYSIYRKKKLRIKKRKMIMIMKKVNLHLCKRKLLKDRKKILVFLLQITDKEK